MSLEFNNPLYIGDKDSAIKKDVAGLKTNIQTLQGNVSDLQFDVGNLGSLDTVDKSSLVNAINETLSVLDPTQTADYINNSKGLKSGEVSTNSTILNDIINYAHSTFDRSKFTVVGSPNITDDGVASGFSGRSYLTTNSVVELTTDSNIKIKIRNTLPSSLPSNHWLLSNGSIDVTGTFNSFINTNTKYFTVLLNGEQDAFRLQQAVPLNKEYDFFITIKNSKIKLGWQEVGTSNLVESSEFDMPSGFLSSGALNIGSLADNVNFHNYGSIDLKQFSITVDGVEVFSGNKTGIDTIKPDDLPLIGSSYTLTDDGVVSNISANNTFNKTIFNDGLSFSSDNLEIDMGFTTPSTISAQNLIGFRTTYLSRPYLDISSAGVLNLYTKNSSGTDITTNICNLSANTHYKLQFTCNSGTLKIYVNGELSQTLNSFNADMMFKGFLAIWANASQFFTGSYDLNEFKVYQNGSLVYQPCLKIPYTESKTGSKIVDSIYRDRVNDMAEQFGFAPYYTLQEDKKGNYTVVGSPTISGDFVASGFSGNIYATPIGDCLKLPGAITLGTDFELYLPFTFSSTIDNRNIYRANNSDNTAQFLASVDTNWGVTVNIKDGTHELGTQTILPKAVYAPNESYVLVLKQKNQTLEYGYIHNGIYTIQNTKTNFPLNMPFVDNFFIGIGGTGNYAFNGTIDLKQLKMYVDNKLAYEAVTDPNFTLPQVELYGLIGQRTLRDSYRNGINYWELYSNRDLEQGGSCTSGVEVTFARPFADTNYVLSVPYSAKSATAFTPTQTGDWIAKGKGIL